MCWRDIQAALPSTTHCSWPMTAKPSPTWGHDVTLSPTYHLLCLILRISGYLYQLNKHEHRCVSWYKFPHGKTLKILLMWCHICFGSALLSPSFSFSDLRPQLTPVHWLHNYTRCRWCRIFFVSQCGWRDGFITGATFFFLRSFVQINGWSRSSSVALNYVSFSDFLTSFPAPFLACCFFLIVCPALFVQRGLVDYTAVNLLV